MTTKKTHLEAETPKDHPWLSSYPPSVAWAPAPEVKPVPFLLDEAAARFPDNACLDFMGKKLTYAEVSQMVDRAARGFQLLGVKKGTRVGIFLPNTPYYVICYYGALKAGGVVVSYSPMYVERELAQQVEDSGTTIMVTIDLNRLYPKVANLIGRTCLEQVVVCSMKDILPPLKGLLFSVLKRSELAQVPKDVQHIPFEFMLSNDGQPKPVSLNPQQDLAVLQYTGGTTGTPKGAMLTHANLSANIDQIIRWTYSLEHGRERMLCVLPFFHVFGMTVGMNLGVSIGAELILMPRFDLKQTLKTIHEKKPTIFPGVPTIYAIINDDPKITSYDLSSIRFCISGGAPLPLETRKRFEELTGCALVEGYGLSETSPVAACNPLGAVGRQGSAGLPLPSTEIRVCSDENSEEVLALGEKGEIQIRGPQVMAGYWKGPEETAATITDGWLKTGDMGFMDSDGFIHLVDRIKDMIICGGINVYPRTVEEAIYQHPAVLEVAVIGIPESHRGQVPKAFVKLGEGETLTAEELKSFLLDKLLSPARPREIEFRSELPKTLVGKLSKKELVEEEKARRAGKKG